MNRQEKLEWLARKITKWPEDGDDIAVSEDHLGGLHLGDRIEEIVTWLTCQEWLSMREKLQNKPEPDNSWHERGELPPVGVPVELWVGGSFAYNCEFITRRGHHYVMWNLDADRPDAADYMNSQFRPLSTEREKAIEKAVDCVGYLCGIANVRLAIEKLYDAGKLK